jgi:hypothetical protein
MKERGENLGNFPEEMLLKYLEGALVNPEINKKILLYPCCGDEKAGKSEGHVVQLCLSLKAEGDNSKVGMARIYFPIFGAEEILRNILGKISIFYGVEIEKTGSSCICPECYSSKFGSGDESLEGGISKAEKLNPGNLVVILGSVKTGDGGELQLTLRLGREDEEDERVMKSLFPWLGEIEEKLGELEGGRK